jgi:hypothetical protein
LFYLVLDDSVEMGIIGVQVLDFWGFALVVTNEIWCYRWVF